MSWFQVSEGIWTHDPTGHRIHQKGLTYTLKVKEAPWEEAKEYNSLNDAKLASFWASLRCRQEE